MRVGQRAECGCPQGRETAAAAAVPVVAGHGDRAAEQTGAPACRIDAGRFAGIPRRAPRTTHYTLLPTIQLDLLHLAATQQRHLVRALRVDHHGRDIALAHGLAVHRQNDIAGAQWAPALS